MSTILGLGAVVGLTGCGADKFRDGAKNLKSAKG